MFALSEHFAFTAGIMSLWEKKTIIKQLIHINDFMHLYFVGFWVIRSRWTGCVVCPRPTPIRNENSSFVLCHFKQTVKTNCVLETSQPFGHQCFITFNHPVVLFAFSFHFDPFACEKKKKFNRSKMFAKKAASAAVAADAKSVYSN